MYNVVGPREEGKEYLTHPTPDVQLSVQAWGHR